MMSDKPSTWFEWWREEWLWVCLVAFMVIVALSDVRCEIKITDEREQEAGSDA